MEKEHHKKDVIKEMQKSLVVGAYVYLGKRQAYAIIRNKNSDRKLTVKVKKAPQLKNAPSEFEEIEVDILDDEVHVEVEI